jgi:hypothetical protein
VTKRPTAAQRRTVAAADPVTGLLRGTEATLAALLAQGLARRHQRPPHRCYLTSAGRALRERLTAAPGTGAAAPAAAGAAAPAGQTAATPAGAAAPVAGPFAARTGDETGALDGPERTREVRSAWEGLRELRRITNRQGTSALPCPWERAHPGSAVGLALEAAGCRPSARDENGRRVVGGYRVTSAEQPDAVCVTWAPADGPAAPAGRERPVAAALDICAAALERAGWQVTGHAAPRTGERFLLASPRRA